MSEHPWLATGAVILVISAVLVLWARTRPSYDAYGWMVWGYQTLHASLDLGGAPSWKPVPFLFTVPFALFGHYQMWLWMITACAVALAGPVFGARIAFRLCGRGDVAARVRARFARFAPYAAAFVAGAAVLGIEDYFHYILSSQSDPMLVTFLLAALDMGLIGRYRWALVFGVLTGLGRPEVWPFLGLFMLWCWFKVPRMRWMVIAGAVLIAFMWFGIPTITNGRPDVAGQLAKGSPRELKSNQLVGTIKRFHEMQYLPVWIAAAFAVVLAAVRRNWIVLALGVGVVAWLIVEIAFAYHGWPALPRYMFEAAGVVAVLAGVAVGWLLGDVPRIVRGVPAWAGAVLAGDPRRGHDSGRGVPGAGGASGHAPRARPHARDLAAAERDLAAGRHAARPELRPAGDRRRLRELAGLVLPPRRRLGGRPPAARRGARSCATRRSPRCCSSRCPRAGGTSSRGTRAPRRSLAAPGFMPPTRAAAR